MMVNVRYMDGLGNHFYVKFLGVPFTSGGSCGTEGNLEEALMACLGPAELSYLRPGVP